MKKVLCFGDSLTYGYGVAPGRVWHQLIKEKETIRVINRGRNGDTILGMKLRLVDDVLSVQPELCIFMAGSNDLMLGKEVEEVFSEISSINKRIQNAGIDIVLLIPPPAIPSMAQISWDDMVDYDAFNQKIEQLGSLLKKSYPNRCIDLYEAFSKKNIQDRPSLYVDGIHLNEKGNAFIAELLLKNTIFRSAIGA